ncbi:MAG: C_GCAxxG_C_C family protein [Lentisphaeria bacterium]|nr:C_GCAxxG_C_C family protein [Lentisphaeria bacterium]
MTKKELAENYFRKGANCAQAVLCAFAPECGLAEEQAMRLASGFGGGVGRMREVCGAVSGMTLVVNILYGNTDFSDKEAKDRHYARVRRLAEEFRSRTGSVICRELLGASRAGKDSPVSEQRTSAYYETRPCPGLVAIAAEIVEKELSK